MARINSVSKKRPLPARSSPARITNLSKKRSICLNLELADSILSRMRGLMFRRAPASILFVFPSEGVYPIHSFFVPFEFDAVYLDRRSKVTGVFQSIKPFVPLISPPKPSGLLLEFEAGTAKALGVQDGDQMKIELSVGGRKHGRTG